MCEKLTPPETTSAPLRSQTQLTTFEATYSRVMLIRRSTHEILFVTPQLLEFCGAPLVFLFPPLSLTR